MRIIKNTAAAFVLGLAGFAATADATIVQFQTSMGDIEVNLFDKATPETVANFLEYVTEGAYEGTVIHRSIPNFVIQGGGYTFNYTTQKGTRIQTHAPVINEPVFANKRGTIAMAKQGGLPNSATSEWFFNMVDNSAQLDSNNGGFTVFGEVIGDGMDVLDAISALRHIGETPVDNYSAQDVADKKPLTEDNLITIQAVVILDESPDTADDLTPALSTRKDEPAPPPKKKKSGSNGLEFLILLAGIAFYRRRKI